MINKEPIEICQRDIVIASSYTNLSVQEIKDILDRKMIAKERDEMTHWEVYAGYDGDSAELCVQTYRMEYPIETANRIEREEMEEKRIVKQKEKEKVVQEKEQKEQQKRLKDPDYILYRALQEKFKNI